MALSVEYRCRLTPGGAILHSFELPAGKTLLWSPLHDAGLLLWERCEFQEDPPWHADWEPCPAPVMNYALDHHDKRIISAAGVPQMTISAPVHDHHPDPLTKSFLQHQLAGMNLVKPGDLLKITGV